MALGGSLLGGIGLFISRGVVLPTVLSLAWIAFSYATVYPTTVALGNAVFARDRGRFLCGGLFSAQSGQPIGRIISNGGR